MKKKRSYTAKVRQHKRLKASARRVQEMRRQDALKKREQEQGDSA